mgnify:CR=1 FL=1
MAIPFLSDISGKSATFAGDVTTSGNIILSGASNEIIKSNGSIRLNIDSDANQSDRIFIVSTGSNSELFRVDESGNGTFAGTVTANGTVLTGDQTLPTDFVSKASGGTFGGNLIIKHASSPSLTLTDDSPDPDNIGKIDVANTYMTFSLDSSDGIASSRMRFQLDGSNIVEILPNSTYFRQTNLFLENTATSNINFRKDAAITAGEDIGKLNFTATNDESAGYTTGGNIIYEGDGTWDLSSINNAPTRMKIQLRNSSGTLQNAMMLSSNRSANFYGNATFTGNIGTGGLAAATATGLSIKSQSVSSQESAINIIQNGTGTDPIIRMGEKSTNGGRFHMFDSGVEKIAFYTDGTDNHISAGKLGIGTAAPFSKLSINSNGAPTTSGNVATTGLTIHNGAGGTAIQIGTYDGGSYNYIQSNYVNNAGVARELRLMVGGTDALKLSTSANATFAGDITAISGDSHSFLTGNTSNLSSADTTGFRLHQTSYTDGRYTHRFRKKDMSGGVPLYLDFSSGTANVFANLVRFGKYSGESIDVEVNGKLKATHFYGDGSNLTGITVSNADTVDNLHASSFIRSDANDTASGVYTLTNTTTSATIQVTGHAGADNYNYFLNANNDGGTKAVHFVNGSNRTADGGANAYTIRNDGGKLILGSASHETIVAGNVSSQGYAIDAAGLQTFQDFQSKPIDTDSGLFTVGGNGMQMGYSRAISMWSSTDGVWNSWVGTNLRWDGTNFKRASDNGSQNWGNIAGIRFLGNSGTSGAAMQFIIDPPEQSSAPSNEQTIGTTLPASMTALSLNNDLSASFAGNIQANGGLKVVGPSSHNTIRSANNYTLGLDDSNGVSQWWFKAYTNGSFAIHENGVNDKFTIAAGGNATFAGSVNVNTNGLIKYEQNTDVDSSAAEAVASVVHGTHTAAFFDYVIKKGTNVRAGVVTACHDGTNVEYAETSTVDLGDTSDVTLSVDISGIYMRLIATTTSNDWSVKSLIRAI